MLNSRVDFIPTPENEAQKAFQEPEGGGPRSEGREYGEDPARSEIGPYHSISIRDISVIRGCSFPFAAFV